MRATAEARGGGGGCWAHRLFPNSGGGNCPGVGGALCVCGWRAGGACFSRWKEHKLAPLDCESADDDRRIIVKHVPEAHRDRHPGRAFVNALEGLGKGVEAVSRLDGAGGRAELCRRVREVREGEVVGRRAHLRIVSKRSEVVTKWRCREM